MPNTFPRFATCLIVAVCINGSTWWSMGASTAGGETTIDDGGQADSSRQLSHEEINRLIDQLGADSFSDREEARIVIKQLGQSAFDELFAAAEHGGGNKDLEIRLAAKKLLGAIKIRWIDDDLQSEVPHGDDEVSAVDQARAIMKSYDQQLSTEKRNRARQLGTLPPDVAASVLCRIVRYELDEKVSKWAALSLLQLDKDRQHSADVARIVEASLQSSSRTAAGWLTAWAEGISAADKQTIAAAWSRLESLVDAELELLKLYPGTPLTESVLVHDLMIWQANNALRRGQKEKAFELFRELLALMQGTQNELLNSVDWLADNEGWALILETQRRFPSTFSQSAILMYHVALAHRNDGSPEQVQQSVQAALAAGEADSEGFRAGERHRSTALFLQERGLKEWAQGEYRASIAATETGDVINVSSRRLLAEMLFDMGDPMDAAEVMEPTATILSNDEEVRENVARSYRGDVSGLISRRFYFLARGLMKTGEYEAAATAFLEGIEHDPMDLDIIISMFRFPHPTDDFRAEAEQRLKAATGKYRDDVRYWQQKVIESSGSGEISVSDKIQLARANNQFAWLICNTTGDFQEAIRASHKSIMLRPDESSYYDTLAHCYYAVDDFKNAVKYQKRAVEISPFEEVLARKLTLFSEALKEGRKIPEND